ncbi:hypothetical protein THAOC_15209 [Thalassiosira oceanica]|uniref:Uncharacterized protein n=1 Tax=Thalassiosira oceanica TaxID=159749 RepID=K0SSW5_THAOC|nr:hypothetical protein THAOC_15209 [Thalassiosira oceanica]|eukprot:EJK64091.1 hypothetical protein THAOC_15209 [Thalassiosira oceanica]
MDGYRTATRGPTRRLSHLAAALAAWLKSEDSDSSSDEDATDHDGDDDSFVPGPTIGSQASVWPFSKIRLRQQH